MRNVNHICLSCYFKHAHDSIVRLFCAALLSIYRGMRFRLRGCHESLSSSWRPEMLKIFRFWWFLFLNEGLCKSPFLSFFSFNVFGCFHSLFLHFLPFLHFSILYFFAAFSIKWPTVNLDQSFPICLPHFIFYDFCINNSTVSCYFWFCKLLFLPQKNFLGF